MPVPLVLLGLLAVLPAAGRLSDAIDHALASPHLDGARVAVSVVDVTTRRDVYARRADAPMGPASNLKLLTTAAAASLLGPDARFETRVYATVEPDADGVLEGGLVVVGSGDPSLRADLLAPEGVSDPADVIAELVQRAGLRAVRGRLVLDPSAFDDEYVRADWDPADLDRDYAAPVGALSLHGNCLRVGIDPRGPSARLLTATRGYRVEDELRRAAKARTYAIGATRPDADGVVRVWGKVGSGVGDQELAVPVRDPSVLFGGCLLRRLSDRGVAVEGGLAVVPGAAARLGDAPLLAVVGTPLSRALVITNKESDNSTADHLFKALADDGSFAGGERAVLAFLAEQVGAPVDGLVLRDGSGLAATNRVTARALTDTLAYMADAPGGARDLFLRSLPVAGLDGTLHDRLTEAPYRGAVRAKTGFITGVSALSGYAVAEGGAVLAFSILFNDIKPQTNVYLKAVQDDICRALVSAR